MEHKAGFVALLGRPNVGKSTLLNALLRFKLSIVSPKPQTTRHQILGLLNTKGCQICFLDTPGMLEDPRDLLQRKLLNTARRTVREDADVLVVLVEAGSLDKPYLDGLRTLMAPDAKILLAVNKIDLQADRAATEKTAAEAAKILGSLKTLYLAAHRGEGVDALLAAIVQLIPESPPYYNPGQLSDRWERFFVSEIIREGLFELYHQEIPHACAVDIEEFKEKPERKDAIRAVIYCERASQKGILLGKKGFTLRALKESRVKAIEKFLGRGVDLDLWIKVRANWRKDPAALKQFGYI
jgi:GTPase